MFLGGVAAGVIGGKLVPPLIGIVTASGRVKAGGDPFELLIEDHRQILSVCEQLSQAPQDSKMQRSRLFLALKRKLAKHAMAEEDVVYPIVHGQARESDESKQLYDDHAEMKILLYEMEDKLMSGADWSPQVAALTDLIRSHAAEEEQVVFPMLRRQMEQSRLPAMSGQISREEALVV